MIGARPVFTSSAVGFMRARSAAVMMMMMPRVFLLPGRCRLMQADDIRVLENRLARGSDFKILGLGARNRTFAAPAHHLHAEFSQ